MKGKETEGDSVKVLIIGLGNPLAGDDGLGPYIVRYLQQSSLPHGVEAMECRDAFAILPDLTSAGWVVIVDAVQTGGEPGTIYRIPLRRLTGQRKGFSQHEISLLTLYQLPFSKWQLSLPDGVLLAVEVGEIKAFCAELSPALKERVPALVGRIHEEVRQSMGAQPYPS